MNKHFDIEEFEARLIRTVMAMITKSDTKQLQAVKGKAMPAKRGKPVKRGKTAISKPKKGKAY